MRSKEQNPARLGTTRGLYKGENANAMFIKHVSIWPGCNSVYIEI